jgi:small conductance mechanosensitive channel
MTASFATVPITAVDLDQTWSRILFGPFGKTTLIIVLALLARTVVHRLVTRVAERITWGRAGLAQPQDRESGTTSVLAQRREQRSRTMAGVLRTVATVTVVTIAVLMVLPLFGLSAGPLLASAGIIGVALGFGAQTLVKDLLSGMFMIAEDQYGVGDVIDLGRAYGEVEAVGLRVTRLRDRNGIIWYVRNGEVLRVGNHSQSWSRAVLDVGVDPGEDLSRVRKALGRVGEDLRRDPGIAPLLVEDLTVQGVESLSEREVVLRVSIRTQPLRDRELARGIASRIKERFDSDGIRLTSTSIVPHRRGDGSGGETDEEEFEPPGD